MRSTTPYCHMVYGGNKQKQIRVRTDVVRYAQRHGIKPAARYFRCSSNTVRKWKKRFEKGGSGSLMDRSRAPKFIPHKTDGEQERLIIEARQHAPCYGPKRLKQAFCIKASEGAIQRIIKSNSLTRKRRKKYQKKNDLREIKAKYKALGHVQVDVKYLTDLPYYWPQMNRLGLPRFQYTLRDTKSGAMFLGYCQEYSEAHSSLFVNAYFDHLKAIGIDLSQVIVQSDNGGEFGGTKRNMSAPGFVNMIREEFCASHQFIPPGMSNANADVESVHATIESEFFDLELFNSKEDFYKKTNCFQLFYNIQRPNSFKYGKTPFQIILEDHPNIDPKVIFFPTVDLDHAFRIRYLSRDSPDSSGGQYLPALPAAEYEGNALTESGR